MLVPLVVALAVLAVVAAAWQLRGGREDSSTGTATPPSAGAEPGSPGSGSAGSPGPSPAAPVPVSPMPSDHLDPLVVPVTAYTVHGLRLRLYYTSGLPSCYGRIGTPEVDETAHDVTVTLRRVPPGRAPAQACPDIAMLGSVDVTLASPLGARLVRDGGRGGAVVPEGRPFGDVQTPLR